MQDRMKLMSFGGRLIEWSMSQIKGHSSLSKAFLRSSFIAIRPER